MITRYCISDTQKEIIKTILYFDVFNYPLNLDEIYQNSSFSESKNKFEIEINSLIQTECIYKLGNFYSTANNIKPNVERRLSGNVLAEKMLSKANDISKQISKFPFVSGVCISGGLSKNYFDENSDFDFFIITKPNRLWICRTLYIILFKTFSKEKKKLYCLNYFISESDLAINDKNLFVATELAYLIPTINHKAYKSLLGNNLWYKLYFKNKIENREFESQEINDPWYKILIETIFYGRFGNFIDSTLLNITLSRWRQKYPEMSNEDFDLQFRSRKHVCKRHTHGYQNKVLQMYADKIKDYESKFNINLT